jgi:hypothetical protein
MVVGGKHLEMESGVKGLVLVKCGLEVGRSAPHEGFCFAVAQRHLADVTILS